MNNTPTASIPQAPGMSPTGASVPRTGPGLDLMGQFTAEAEEAGLVGPGQSGGKEARPPVVPKVVPKVVSQVVSQVVRPLPGPFPALTGLNGGRKKRKSMKKKKTKKRKSMKKRK